MTTIDSPRPAADEESTEASTAAVLSLLSSHVPLTLLLDLAPPEGPDSRDILIEEPADGLDWIPAPRQSD